MPVWFDLGRPAGTKSHASTGGQHALGGRAKSGGRCLAPTVTRFLCLLAFKEGPTPGISRSL